MNFTPSVEQEMLRESARQFLSERFPIERVIEIADGDGFDHGWWHDVAELGWTGISIPEEAGGAGLSLMEEAIVAEELGRGLFPGPFFSTVVLAVPALRGEPKLLAPVLQGTSLATLAWAGLDGEYAMRVVSTTAADHEGQWELVGSTLFVPDLSLADTIVVVAQGLGGVGLWAVRKESPGVRCSDLPTVDTTRRLGAVTLSSAPGTLLAEPGAPGEELLHAMRDRALTALAAEAVGVAERALELAVDHARERQQFGRPIGTFQAVSHELADAFVHVEAARSLSMWAAWAVATSSADASEAAAAAKAYAAETAVRTCERAIQILGGVGFTWEHPIQRYYKRALWIAAYLGWPARHRASVAASLLEYVPGAERVPV